MSCIEKIKEVKTDQAVFRVYELDEQERIDDVTLGMMSNNTISGIIPVQFIQMDQDRTLRYKPAYDKTLEQLLEDNVDRETNLKLVKNIAQVIGKISDYMIPGDELCLDSKAIYAKEDGSVEIICVPVLKEENVTEKEALITLLKNCNEKFFDKQGSVYWELYRFLEKDNVSLNDLFKEIEKKEIELTVEDNGPLVLEARRKKKESGPVVLSKANVTEPKRNGEVVLSRADRISPKSVETVSKKEPEAPKNSGVVMLSGRLEEKTNPQPKIYEDTSDECCCQYLSGYFEGTADMEGNKPKAYLIRKSTDEKIFISKSVFRIGKDKSSTDYRVDNNPVISRNHAIIMGVEQDYFIVDTNSKNHVYVNGVMIAPNQKVKLAPYAAVRLANEEFTFMIDGV